MLVSLNLSNTKLGSKGCIEISQTFNKINQDTGQPGILKILDISQNKIDTEGVCLLMHSLR